MRTRSRIGSSKSASTITNFVFGEDFEEIADRRFLSILTAEVSHQSCKIQRKINTSARGGESVKKSPEKNSTRSKCSLWSSFHI